MSWPRDTLEQPMVLPDAPDEPDELDPEDEALTTPSGSRPFSSPPIEEELLDVTHPGRADSPQRGRPPVIDGAGDPAETDPTAELVQSFDRPFADALRAIRPEGGGPLGNDTFGELPDAALAELAKGIRQREFAPGELILREGDPGQACYVVIRGSVRVLKRDPTDPRNDLIEVNRLRDGALFGEFALLSDQRRHATVQAIEDTLVYEIPRRLLQRIADSYPEVTPALERFYRERLLATLVSTAPFFRPLEHRLRVELLARFRALRAEAGERVVREGERAGGFYLIVLGSVEIVKTLKEGRKVLVASLGEGAYFGEMSLLRGDVARASVVATGPLELAMLDPRAFYDLIAAHPVLWEHLRQEAHRRELETYEIIAGLTGSS